LDAVNVHVREVFSCLYLAKDFLRQLLVGGTVGVNFNEWILFAEAVDDFLRVCNSRGVIEDNLLFCFGFRDDILGCQLRTKKAERVAKIGK
jgi:hypothetical protein